MKTFCENCGKKGTKEYKNFGSVWQLCKKCADLPIKELNNNFEAGIGKKKGIDNY